MIRKRRKNPQGQIRITGGKWRSRRLAVADAAALRPSSDRTRETLFNWLGHDLTGLVCADLYAGTGALGFEALSRGAESCEFVEIDSVALTALREAAGLLVENARRVRIVQQPVERWISEGTGVFDLVFADPPFALGGWHGLLSSLQPRLRAGARVYVEGPAAQPWSWPETFELLKETRVGEASLRLFGWAGCA